MEFRPGAQSVRSSLGWVVTAVGTAACAPVPDRSSRAVKESSREIAFRVNRRIQP